MSESKDAVNQRIEATRQGIEDAERDLDAIEAHLEGLADQRARYALLQQAVESVQKLQEAGVAEMFWGDKFPIREGVLHLIERKKCVDAFEQEVLALESRRDELRLEIGGATEQIADLAEDLYDLEQEEESLSQEWVVEREESDLPKVAQILPWMRGFEDDLRFRKTLGGSLAASILLGLIIPLIDIPLPERDELIEVPERFVQLIQKQEKKPLPPPRPMPEPPVEKEPPKPKPEKKVAEKKPEETKPKIADKPKPAVAKQQSTREKVATKGILAFRESFSNLADSTPSVKLGAKARVSNSGQAATGRPERNMVTSKASGSSGGINLSNLSRDVGGGGGGAMEGVLTTQVASSIAGGSGSDRPLSDGAYAGRTDEEIQIVFDRYKAALYRLYNRELRKDPSLRGQMVLKLTIEPDGSVSLCRLQGSDMDAPQLAQQIVTRVSKFDFGAKDVPSVTIVYPIDFLPAA